MHIITKMEMLSFWWNFHHWLHWKLSFWQLPVQPVIKISSKWHFHFSDIIPHTEPSWSINSIALHISTNPRVPTIHHLSLLDWFTLGGCARSHCFPYGIGQFPVSNGTAIPNTIPACAVHCNFFHVHWFHLVCLSVCLSVHLSVCGQNGVHCFFYNTCRIHFIFIHLIKQLPNVCRV